MEEGPYGLEKRRSCNGITKTRVQTRDVAPTPTLHRFAGQELHLRKRGALDDSGPSMREPHPMMAHVPSGVVFCSNDRRDKACDFSPKAKRPPTRRGSPAEGA